MSPRSEQGRADSVEVVDQFPNNVVRGLINTDPRGDSKVKVRTLLLHDGLGAVLRPRCSIAHLRGFEGEFERPRCFFYCVMQFFHA